ncbi:MAG: hypothetical protein ACOC1G_05485 [Phycisphaeraceae bacterium]
MSVAADEGCVRRVVVEPEPERWATASGQPPHAGPIYSGHQAQLWHPGILAKDIVAAHFARQSGIEARHLVVDQDAHSVWRIEFPHPGNESLESRAILLAADVAQVPTGYQPAADPDTLKGNLSPLPRDAADRLADAIDHAAAEDPDTLARQVAAITQRLAAPAGADLPRVFATSFAKAAGFGELVEMMIADAQRCVRTYNAEVSRRPEAGMRVLAAGRELVELPLWACRWKQPRERVFVDVADAKRRLAFADGTPMDTNKWDILPRALAMTAYLRGGMHGGPITRFIHGLGGGVYDRITDAWWQRWRDAELAPAAVATADVTLGFDVPLADADELSRAKWHRHHTPHNVDRLLDLDTPEARRKRELIAHMDDDRDHARRSAAYHEVQSINESLRRDYAEVVRAADRRLEQARRGVNNAGIATRRDWPLFLYEPSCLQQLAAAMEKKIANDATTAKTDKTAKIGRE